MNRLIGRLTMASKRKALLRSEQEEHVGAYSEWCMRVIYIDTSKQFKGVNGGANAGPTYKRRRRNGDHVHTVYKMIVH